MATTLTASLALSTYTPPANHMGNVLKGQYVGVDVSSSASGLILLAKIPAYAKNVQLIVQHNTASTAWVGDYGILNGVTASASVSAFLGAAAAGSVHISAPYQPTWDDANSEKFKYVTVNHDSGTVTASISIRYQISYDFNP